MMANWLSLQFGPLLHLDINDYLL